MLSFLKSVQKREEDNNDDRESERGSELLWWSSALLHGKFLKVLFAFNWIGDHLFFKGVVLGEFQSRMKWNLCCGRSKLTGSTSEQNMREPASAKKSFEGFVQWKESCTSKGGTGNAATSEARGQGSERGMQNSSSSGLIPASRISISGRGGQGFQVSRSFSESQQGKVGKSALASKILGVDSDTGGGRIRGEQCLVLFQFAWVSVSDRIVMVIWGMVDGKHKWAYVHVTKCKI